MSADPITEPVNEAQDPIDLLIEFEKASKEPIRAEYVEGMVIVPPQPDHNHNRAATELYFQLRTAGIGHVGIGNGYRTGVTAEKTLSLLVPDFYVMRREPSDLDEAYRRTNRGWYPIELLHLAGEVTSTNHETDTGPKYRSYAAAGVPLYVIVHRYERKVYVHSEPVPDKKQPTKSHYRTTTVTELGGKFLLPAPYPALDTSLL
ncbi:Uma2 family endonuclease [Streptomyces mauvecolor]|uniref:Uma2 family endonuclease n=1 Tax=Streptomyces mauvecolor TaxID=58345 RepID=A0ABV9UKA7_9ACTN